MFGSTKADVFFVFDEIDKIIDEPDHIETSNNGNSIRRLQSRKEQIDAVLSGLKNFLTKGEARYFVITGRDVLDTYYMERIFASPLYDSIFNRVFEVPSFLSDHSDGDRVRVASMVEIFVCRQLLDPFASVSIYSSTDPGQKTVSERLAKDPYAHFRLSNYAKFLSEHSRLKPEDIFDRILALRNFVHFLTIHTQGNIKKLQILFESFVLPRQISQGNKLAFQLSFRQVDMRRILLASNTFMLVHQNLIRQLSPGNDKIAVSTFFAVHYLLKFHSIGFSRGDLDRMTEALDMKHSSELSTIVDMLLTNVLRPYIRRIRFGVHRYRFLSLYEQEVRYISYVSELESTAFNFSTDATEVSRIHYEKSLVNALDKGAVVQGGQNLSSYIDIGTISIVLGDLYLSEQRYDDAKRKYRFGLDFLTESLDKSKSEDTKVERLLYCIEAIAKLGFVEEKRQYYVDAMSLYEKGISMIEKYFEFDAQTPKEWPLSYLELNDSKLELLKYPYWALSYLHVKRGTFEWRGRFKTLEVKMFKKSERDRNAVYQLKSGRLAFYYNDYKNASKYFLSAIDASGVEQITRDRSAYIGGEAAVLLAQSEFIGFMKFWLKEMVSRTPSRLDLHDNDLPTINKSNNSKYFYKRYRKFIRNIENFTSLDVLISQFLRL